MPLNDTSIGTIFLTIAGFQVSISLSTTCSLKEFGATLCVWILWSRWILVVWLVGVVGRHAMRAKNAAKICNMLQNWIGTGTLFLLPAPHRKQTKIYSRKDGTCKESPQEEGNPIGTSMFPKVQRGVHELVRNFRDVFRSWLWRGNPVSCSGSVLNFRGHSVMHDAISSPRGGYRAAGASGLRHTHIAT